MVGNKRNYKNKKNEKRRRMPREEACGELTLLRDSG